MSLREELWAAREVERQGREAEAKAEASPQRFRWRRVALLLPVVGLALAALIVGGLVGPPGTGDLWLPAAVAFLLFAAVFWPRAFRLGFRAQRSHRLGPPLRAAFVTWIVSPAVFWLSAFAVALWLGWLVVAHVSARAEAWWGAVVTFVGSLGNWNPSLSHGDLRVELVAWMLVLAAMILGDLVARTAGAMRAEGEGPVHGAA